MLLNKETKPTSNFFQRSFEMTVLTYFPSFSTSAISTVYVNEVCLEIIETEDIFVKSEMNNK